MPNEIDGLDSHAANVALSANNKHLKQKRARSQLSCAPCRTGKLKCNRAHDPACDQCIKRSRESSCLYLPPPAKHKPTQNVQGRIQHLESLVVDLMQNTNRNNKGSGQEQNVERNTSESSTREDSGAFSQPTPPSETEVSPKSSDRGLPNVLTPPDEIDNAGPLFGQLKISKDEISYVGESHWGAILNSISELKREFGEEEEDDDNDEEDQDQASEMITESWNGRPMDGPHLVGAGPMGVLLGKQESHLTKDQLIANIPEKKVVDRLLSLWFNSPDPFKPIIHAPTFQDEYRQFWKSPKETPTMWLGLLFSILSLATSFGLRDCDRSSPQAKSTLARLQQFHSLAASAAVLADFTKPKEYTLECLILYASGIRSHNAFVNVWLMVGMAIRLALRMGYHRDASHYPEITAFCGEMRRRTWAVLHMIEILLSFQLGLPSMVRTIQFDTQPPHNLLDRDFNVNTKVLPPGRAVHELTPSSYTRAKFRIVRIFANAAELSHSTGPPAYGEMMALDRELELAKAAIPPLLQMPETTELVTDPAEQLMCRFNLDLLYLKTKLTLHRRFQRIPLEQLSHEEQCMGIGGSRKICTKAALRVLEHHRTIYSASLPGGQLESVKWYMGSISTHDFLLAAMITCLELSLQIEMRNRSGHHVFCPHRAPMMHALEQSQMIWSEASGRTRGLCGIRTSDAHSKGEHMFDETEKASRAMALMIRKVKAQFGAAEMECMPTQHQPSVSGTSDTQETLLPSTNSTASQSNDITAHMLESNPSSTPADKAPHSESSNDQPRFDFNSNIQNTAMDGYTPDQLSSSLPPDQDINNLEFPMIDQMLDTSLSNLDWVMWDQQIGTGQQSASWMPPADDIQQDTSYFSRGVFSSALPGNSAYGSDVPPYTGAPSAHQPSAMSQAGDSSMTAGQFIDVADWGGSLLNNSGNDQSGQRADMGNGVPPERGAMDDDLDMGMLQNTQYDMNSAGYEF